MNAARVAGKPYFIWLALSSPHAPYQRPPLALLSAYKRKLAGIMADLARAEREAGDLRVNLARAEERIRAVEAVARSDVEAAKRVVEAELAAREEVLSELRAQVRREVARGEALATELAELRRPWGRRLWG